VAEPEGLRTLNNASVLNSVAFSDDQTALIVPATALIPDNVAFSTSAYGVHTTCQSITSQCFDPRNPGGEVAPTFDCSASTNFKYSTYTSNVTFGALNSSGIFPELGSMAVDLKCVLVD
jgi:hypothetical protein